MQIADNNLTEKEFAGYKQMRHDIRETDTV